MGGGGVGARAFGIRYLLFEKRVCVCVVQNSMRCIEHDLEGCVRWVVVVHSQ